MKNRKRLVSFILAILLICALALPVSARTVSLGRSWSGFTYATSDTCNSRSFYCVIEASSADYKLSTNVTTWTGSIEQETYYGSPSYMISSNVRSVSYAMSHIVCKHLLSGLYVSTENVSAS